MRKISDKTVSFFIMEILIVIIVGIMILGTSCVYNNYKAQNAIINGYVIDKDMTNEYITQQLTYNAACHLYTCIPIHHSATYTLVIQSDNNEEVVARYSVSAGKYEIYNIGDYIKNVNEVLRKD